MSHFVFTREYAEMLAAILKVAEGDDYEIHYTHSDLRGEKVWILGNNTDSEILLSFFKNMIIVQRIYLEKRRKGTFTKIVDWLIQLTKGTQYTEIWLEAVLTEAMYSWCKKHHAESLYPMSNEDDWQGGTFKITIRE